MWQYWYIQDLKYKEVVAIGSNIFSDVVVASGCRTPVGSFGGVLKKVSSLQLAKTAVEESLNRSRRWNGNGSYIRNVLENGDIFTGIFIV